MTVVGDSVLAASVYPAGGHRSLAQYLADRGFGPIVARAASGLTAGYVPTGYFGMPAHVTVSSWLAEWRAEGWDAPHVIVNVGAIDSGFCRTDLACARNSIQHVVDALGPGHHIWWPQITRFYTHQAEADTWNTALAEFDAARDDFTTWDWPSVLVADSFDVYDGVHLASPAELARRSERIALEVYRVWATAHRVGADAPLPATTAAPARLTAVDPVRVLDTRQTHIVGAGQTVAVTLASRVPAAATSVVVNVTATQGGADGFLTAFPCGAAVPEASNVNYLAGQDRAASAVVPIGAGRSVCVYSSAASHVIVDLAGYLAPGGSLGLVPVDPTRLVDEVVPAGTTRRVPIPGSADAVAVGLTADAAETWGYLTAYPCDDQVPEASSVNYGPGRGGCRLGVRRHVRRRDLRVHVGPRSGDRRPAGSVRTRRGLVRGGQPDSRPRHPQRPRRLGAHPRCRPGRRHRRRPARRGRDHRIIDGCQPCLGRVRDGPSVWVSGPERVERQLPTRPRRGERRHGARRRGRTVVPVGIDGDPHVVRRDRLVDHHLTSGAPLCPQANFDKHDWITWDSPQGGRH